MRKGSSSQRSLKQVAKAGHTRSMTIGVDLEIRKAATAYWTVTE
jgi:hypothetical protein